MVCFPGSYYSKKLSKVLDHIIFQKLEEDNLREEVEAFGPVEDCF